MSYIKKADNDIMNYEKIYDIEKKIAGLKFLERDLIKDRDIGRLRSLDLAEKTEVIEEIIKSFLITLIKADRKDILVYSYPSKFTGRDDEEFLSEVKVEIRYKPLEKNIDYSELACYVYLNKGFQNKEVQELEKQIMDRLYEIKKDVDELKEWKKSLKQNN